MKIKMVPVFRGFLPVAFILAGLSIFAGEAGRYAGDKWAFVDAKKAMDAAREITTAKYPDSDDATVEKRMVRVYRADGTGETQDEAFVKVLTEKGKRGNRMLGLSYMLPYFTVEVIKLEVIKAGGEVVAVDVEANSKDTIDDSQMAMNIYDPNNRVLQVNVPKVEIGDVVHSITRLTINRPIIPGEAAESNVFEGRGYIRHVSYEVYAPADKPLKRVFLRDEIPETVKYSTQPGEDNFTVHRWEVNNVQRMFDESSMPPYEEVLQRLFVSTTPDWPTVSKWYWGVCKPHLDAATPDMKKTVGELTAGAKTDMDKVKAVFYHVSKKIRYMGLTPEKDRPGFEPHDVNLTFEKKYGVCRDKAALLVSLLRMAGLDAYPVLVNVGLKKDPEVPDAGFNHAIVGVELKKGEYVLMDPTDENTRDLLPSYECNQSYLVCRPEGETIRTCPINPPEENMMRVKTTAVLNAAGALEAKSELSFDGINDNNYRSMFARMKPDDKRRFFERSLKDSMPGARLKSLKLFPEDMLDVSVPVRAELEFAVDGMIASGNGKAVVSMPWIGKGMGIVNFILGGAGLEKRKYPMQTYVACGLKEDIALRLGDGFGEAVSLPSCSPVQDECLSYQQRFDLKNQLLTCSRELKLKTVEFTPDQYLKLKKTLEQLQYDQRKALVMVTSPDGPVEGAQAPDLGGDTTVESDARLVESRKELEVKDAHTGVLKVHYIKRILNYNGKIREAEVKIDYNPACQEARLIRAVVTSKSGQRQEISKDEINVMDAGWNASAKRYTGGKVLVANLPGVDIGSTIEVEFEISSKDRAFVSGFESFQFFDDLEKKTFQLTAPAGVKIEKMVSGSDGIVKAETQSKDGKQVFQWRAEGVKALPSESQLPPEWLYSGGVGYFAGDVKSYLEALRKVMVDRASKRAKVDEVTHKLTGDTKTRLDAAKAIRDFVAKSIRQAGPSFSDLPLNELSAADTTLTDGYGHAADRAILLYAMLSAAGFQPEFVLASGLPPIDPIQKVVNLLPLPYNFQHPLVRIKVDGTAYYLNDTDQYSRMGSTSFDGRLGMSLATQAYETIKAAEGCKDKTETVYSMSLSENGKARIGISRSFYGQNYNRLNRFFSELPPEQRKRHFQEIVSGVAQGARPMGDLVTQFDCYPGIEQFTVEIDKYSVVDGKYLYFDLPFTPSLFPSGADRRTLPLFISGQSETTFRTEIELPQKFRHFVMAPKSEELNVPGGGGKARVNSTEAGGKYVIRHQLETAPAIIDAKDYPIMQKVQSSLAKKSSKVFLLEGE